ADEAKHGGDGAWGSAWQNGNRSILSGLRARYVCRRMAQTIRSFRQPMARSCVSRQPCRLRLPHHARISAMAIHDNILDTIGRTPIVRLHRIAPGNVELYAKVESFNPGGSVKDRLALAIILDAEARGLLKPGATVVEATSGNTGVALAMVCAARGYRFVATMAETFSIERRKLMRAYGARVILTPAAERGSGMVRRAAELAEKHGWFLARQFENEANPAYHRQTTAAEILRDFAGRRLDHFVTGWGTGGTFTGVGEVLKVARPEVRVTLAEPSAAPLVQGKEWSPHKIQGWTPDFVPKVLNREVASQVLSIDDADAIDAARRLAQAEGNLTR